MKGYPMLETLEVVYGIIANYNETTVVNLTCVSKINHYVYYQQMIIPALVITFVFAMLQTRRNKFLHIFYGRPGLVYPMDALTTSASISFVAAFGGTLSLVLEVIFYQKFAFQYDGPLALKTLVLVASMIWYGIVFFPVFASLSLKSIFSYGLGSLYVWAMLAIRIYRLAECDYPVVYRLFHVAQYVPHLLCLTYLSISLPVRFFLALKTKKYFHSEETDLDVPQTLTYIKESYQGVYVRKLLRRPPPKPKPPVTKCGKIQALLIKTFHRVVYKNEKGFRYSTRIVSVLMMGGFVLYTVTTELLSGFVPLFDAFIKYADDHFDGYYPTGYETFDFSDPVSWIYIIYFLLLSLKNCTIVSVTLALVIGLFSILHMLSSYRSNLLALYRGDHLHIPAKKHRSNSSLMVGCMRYAGYQVAYIAWGFIVQCVILFLLCMAISVIIILLRGGVSSWLVNRVLQLWPILLWTLVLNILQLLLAKFLFLQRRGDTLSIDNRRFFFIFTYFMFFFNIFLGLVSCLLRIIKAIIFGALFLPRLDHSTLSRAFQFFDPGFAAYVGFIHVENQHTHPVMIVFIRLMLMNLHFRKLGIIASVDLNGAIDTTSSNKVGNVFQQIKIEMSNGKSLSKEAKRKKYKAWFNWLLFYTLINNPQIRVYRKGYMQLVLSARRRGLKVPVSDLPTTDLTEWLAQDEGNSDVTDTPNEVKKRLDSNGKDLVASYDKLEAGAIVEAKNVPTLKSRPPTKWHNAMYQMKREGSVDITDIENQETEISRL